MKLRQLLLTVGLVLGLLCGGCAASRSAEEAFATEEERPQAAQPPAATAAAAESLAEMDYAKGEGVLGGAASAVENVPDRMIVRTVAMSVVVQDTDAMLAQIQELVKTHGGYVAESNRWLSNEQAHATVVLRVPADKLDAVLGVLRDSSITVENESSSGDDVTEEYVDISARLRNLEATEQELLALLTEVRKNRGSAEDILAIHSRITEIRAQIESLKGRQQYLERSAALATIRIDIRPKEMPGTIIEPARWDPAVTLNNALRGLVNAGQVLLDMLIWIVILSPIFLIPALIIWVIVRAIRRSGARRKTSGAEPGGGEATQ